MKFIKILLCVSLLILLFPTKHLSAASFISPDKDNGNVNLKKDQPIDDSVFIFGDGITINTPINGDVFVAGNNITINSPVKGNIFAMGSAITLNNTVDRDVFVLARQLILTKNTLINKNLNARVSILEKDTSSVIKGTNRVQVNTNTGNLKMTALIYSFLSSLLIGVLILKLFPSISQQIILLGKKEWGKNFLLGAGSLILIPIVAILFLITLIGIPIGLILISILTLNIYLSTIVCAYFIGNFIAKKPLPEIVSLIIGLIFINILRLNAAIAPLLDTLVLLFGLGLVLNIQLKLFKK